MKTKKQKVVRAYVVITDAERKLKRESLTVYGGTPQLVRQILVKAIEREDAKPKTPAT